MHPLAPTPEPRSKPRDILEVKFPIPGSAPQSLTLSIPASISNSQELVETIGKSLQDFFKQAYPVEVIGENVSIRSQVHTLYYGMIDTTSSWPNGPFHPTEPEGGDDDISPLEITLPTFPAPVPHISITPCSEGAVKIHLPKFTVQINTPDFIQGITPIPLYR